MSNCQDMPLDNEAHAFPVITQTILLSRRDALLVGFGVFRFFRVLVSQLSVRAKEVAKKGSCVKGDKRHQW